MLGAAERQKALAAQDGKCALCGCGLTAGACETKPLLGSSRAPRMEAERPKQRRWNGVDDPVGHCLAGNSLLLTGLPGTGKTHLARTIGRGGAPGVQDALLRAEPGPGGADGRHWVRRYVRGGSAQKLDWLVVEEITQLDMALWADQSWRSMASKSALHAQLQSLVSCRGTQSGLSSKALSSRLAQERLHLRPGVPVVRPVPLRVEEVGLVRELQDGAARVSQRGLRCFTRCATCSSVRCAGCLVAPPSSFTGSQSLRS